MRTRSVWLTCVKAASEEGFSLLQLEFAYITQIRVNSCKKLLYGCAGGTRTLDLRLMGPASYQLLYRAIFGISIASAVPSAISVLPLVIQLMELTMERWYQGLESNQRPFAYEAIALSTELPWYKQDDFFDIDVALPTELLPHWWGR